MLKSCKSTDFRVPLSVCTMFNVLMDAKKQCSKLCVLDQGQEVRHNPVRDTFIFTLVDVLMRLMVFIKSSRLCSVDSWEVKTKLRTLNCVTLISHLNSCKLAKIHLSVSPFIQQTCFWVELVQVLSVSVKCFVLPFCRRYYYLLFFWLEISLDQKVLMLQRPWTNHSQTRHPELPFSFQTSQIIILASHFRDKYDST